MKAAQFNNLGKPEEVIEVVELERPVPGPGQVLIKVTCCNINPSDIMYVQGYYGIQPELPSTGGFEGVGVIESTGDDVSLLAGTSVIFTTAGVWQEYVVVAAKGVIPKPEGMQDEVACQAFINPYTAYAMIRESRLEEGQWLMITAGGSTFGKLALQLAKQKGIKVICTVRNDHMNQQLLDMGAHSIVNTTHSKWHKEVYTITEGAGVNCIFDAVGGEVGTRAMETLANNGVMMVFGLLSLKPSVLNNGLMIFKNLTVRGFWLSSWIAGLPKEERLNVTKEVLTLLSKNELQLDVEATYPLDDIKSALKHAQQPGRTGKILLDLR